MTTPRQVGLMLHFDSAGPFVDSSVNAQTVTTAGSVTLNTTDQLFGAGCASFPGTYADYLTIPAAVAGPLDFNSCLQWTIEFWIKPSTITVPNGDRILWETQPSGSVKLQIQGGGSLVLVLPGGAGFGNVSSGGGAIVAGSWQHIAVVRDFGQFYIFVNGVQVAYSNQQSQTGVITSSTETTFKINGGTPFDDSLAGLVDDFRITTRAALYTEAFTPAGPLANTLPTNVVYPAQLTSTGLTALQAYASITGVVNTIDFSVFSPSLDMSLIDLTQSPVMVFALEVWPSPNATPTVTFAGYPCTLGPIAGSSHERLFAILPLTVGMTFANTQLVIDYTGTGASNFGAAAVLVVPYQIDQSAIAAALAASLTQVNAFGGPPGSLTFASAVSGTNGDAILTFAGPLDSTTNTAPPYIVSPGGYQGLYAGPVDAVGYLSSLSYRQLPGTESDTITWNCNASGGLSFVGLAMHLPLVPSGANIPNVVGRTTAAATSAITTAGFSLGSVSTVYHPPTTPGTVYLQSPAAGTFEPLGTPVDITVAATAPILTVPDVTNTSQAVAEATLAAALFTTGFVTFTPSVLVIAGNVVSQSPVGGSTAAEGSPVDLVISTGRSGLFVPDILGLTQTEANNAITTIGLTVGTVDYALSDLVPVGEVVAQNPSAGLPVAYGSIVSYTLSLGNPFVGLSFDPEATVISQYANSPTLLRLITNMSQYIDPTANLAAFYSYVWDVSTAQGFGLDIWGKIVGVSRLLQIPTVGAHVGYQNASGPTWDEQPFNALGTFFRGANATYAYLLPDDAYRVLILTKAFSNIVRTTAPAMNRLLQQLFPGRGVCYVVDNNDMSFVFHFDFTLTPIELAILQNSGAVPRPAGVSFTIVQP